MFGPSFRSGTGDGTCARCSGQPVLCTSPRACSRWSEVRSIDQLALMQLFLELSAADASLTLFSTLWDAFLNAQHMLHSDARDEADLACAECP